MRKSLGYPLTQPKKMLSRWICLSLSMATLGSGTAAEPANAGSESPLPLTASENNTIAIPKSSMGKEYLLSGSIIPQVQAATSTGLAGKIVRFELYHDGVDLYESSVGAVVTQDLPSRRLLTTFPIISQSGDKVIIDFNKGMNRVFTESWIGGGPFNAANLSRTLELPQSRVFEVKSEGDQLIIRQNASVRDRQLDQNREERYEIRYFLAPYKKLEGGGKEQKGSELRYARFFETGGQLETTTGRVISKMSRFSLKDPITFYYSANTPKEYVQAVKDGIMYWNRCFGKDVIKAEKGPDGVTAPDAAHNLVQWVPWDSAGSAYADLLIDPRTGSAQRGQAYMTSVFGIGGKSRARGLLRQMRMIAESKDEKADGVGGNIASQMFPSSSLCQNDAQAFAAQLANGLESLLSDETAQDAAVLRASQDYVRQVVAHEVGHVLGLRHNFAGSLGANVTHKEMDDWFRSYLAKDEATLGADKIPTSSVMEYTVLKASVFVGYKIRTTKEPLPHDKAAIQWGYYDSTEPRDKKMLFGTDQDVVKYGDLQRFDFGSEPVVSAYADLADEIKNLPSSIIETYIQAKAPRDPRDKKPLQEVSLNVTPYANTLASHYGQMLSWYKTATRSLKIENDFEFIGELNHRDVVKAHWKSLNDQLEKLGGVDRAAFAFMPVDLKLELKGEPKDVNAAEKIDARKLSDRLAKLLESPAYKTFVGLDDKTNSFTKAEKDIIIAQGKKFFEEFEKESLKRSCQALEKVGRDLGSEANEAVGDDDATARLEKRIIDLAKLVIMAKDENKHHKGKVDKSLVEVVDYKYDQETRLSAARCLADTIGSFKGWSIDAKGELNKQLKDEVESALNIQNFKDFQEGILSRTLREWYLNQQAILALLPPKKPGAK